MADALYLPLRSDSVDGIVSVAVLHHIPNIINRIKFLIECKRILVNKGIIIATVWSIINIRNLITALIHLLKNYKRTFNEFGDAYISWAGKFNRFYHFLTKKEIKKLFFRVNLRIVELMQFGSFPNKKNFLIIALKK